MPYLGLIVLAVMVIALVDIASAEESEVRGLPRLVWILLVIIVPLAGSIAWFVAGRPSDGRPARRAASQTAFPEYDTPGRFVPQDPEADAEFLRECRERAEEQRRAAKRARREREAEGQ